MARTCEMCPPGICRPAVCYCEADTCYLCTVCDAEVHSVNRLAQRHIRRPLTSVETCEAAREQVQSSEDVESLLEGDHVADYDFSDFGSLDTEIPSLALIEDDTDSMFHSKSFSRGLVSYLSWESMIPESVEHVVPDIEPVSPEPELPLEKPQHHLEPVLILRTQKPPSSPLSPYPSSASPSPTTSPKPPSEPTPRTMHKSSSKQDLVRPIEVEHHTPEQRKLLRMKALARFRSKRANRSFAKKVRYECRKQLADSRPRVKGRFVKKSEMALYRKYGAMYRNYMHELSTIEMEDQCVPSL